MLVDARVRLPTDLREPVRGDTPDRLLEQYDRVLNLSEKSKLGTLERLYLELDEANIERAVVHAEYEADHDAAQLNTALAKLVADSNGRFAGVGAIDLPMRTPRSAASQVDDCYDLGLRGVNIQPAFFGMDIDDRRLYPAYSRAEELGLVVALHTGINYSRMHPMRHESPEKLDQVACDFPDLRLVACHGGWPWVAEYCAVARRHPTVFMELGGLAPKYVDRPGTGWDVLRGYMPTLLREQILFATDWPVMPFTRVVDEWSAANLDERTHHLLMGGNAAALFWPMMKSEVDR